MYREQFANNIAREINCLCDTIVHCREAVTKSSVITTREVLFVHYKILRCNNNNKT